MALARRACESVRDEVEAMAYTHTHIGGIEKWLKRYMN
jgi:hypothetical protein